MYDEIFGFWFQYTKYFSRVQCKVNGFSGSRFTWLCAYFPSHSPIGPQPYPVLYAVANPVRGHKELQGSHDASHIIHNMSAIDLSNANPARGYKEVRRPTKGSHHGDYPLLKSIGIQISTEYLPGPTTREHQKLIGVKTMSYLQLLPSEVLPAIQNLSYKLQRTLSGVPSIY